MIAAADWPTLLRWPHLGTTLDVLTLILVPTVIVIGFVAAYFYLARRPLSRRAATMVALAVALPLGALFGYLGFETRAFQAACWRLKPEGMPVAERETCRRLPPQGVEGYYSASLFFGIR